MKSLALIVLLLWPGQPLDDAIQAAVQGARRTPFERPMRAATEIGRPVVVFGTLLVIACFTGAAGPATAREALAAFVPTNLVVEGTKRLIGRPRPDGDRKRSNSSFPSSHAANAFTLAAVFARRWRRAAPVFWIGAAAIALSRVYLNRHFASDVLVGAAIGIACAWLAAWWLERARSRRAAGASGTP